MTATTTDSAEFTERTEPYRRELLAHCYRMLGSADEAEDLVQETYLRAWRGYAEFQGRSSVRTWLYRIATNACLTSLQHHSRRVLPSGLAGPTADPTTTPMPAGPEVDWIQPIRDDRVLPESADPAAIVAAGEHLRLALMASLQYLPGRQRAVLILREVLAFPAAEVAEMLGLSTAAVKSMLQRARARLAEVSPDAEGVTEPTDPAAQELLAQYMAAFERSDVTILERALRQDAALEMVGTPTWFGGLTTCLPFIAQPWVIGTPGEWRMTPVRANGQPAVITHHRDENGVYQPWGVAVITTTTTGIARIVVWQDAGLVRAFSPGSSDAG